MKMLITRGIAAGVAFLAMFTAQSTVAQSITTDTDTNTQLAELYQLEVAFHRAGTVHNSVTVDSAAVIDQRIKDMLSLWAVDAQLAFVVGSDANGNPIPNYYIGRGDLDTNCLPPSSDPNNKGTICSFFKYVSGSFQPQNRLVELTPTYTMSFDIHGNTAAVYFQCWFFDESNFPTTLPLKGHVTAEGTATKVDGAWLLSFITIQPAGIPVP